MGDVLKIISAGAAVLGIVYALTRFKNGTDKPPVGSAAWNATYGNPVWSGHKPLLTSSGNYVGLNYGPKDIRSDVYYD